MNSKFIEYIIFPQNRIFPITNLDNNTTYELNKLARCHHERALLQDALRRGIPYHHIPFILAGVSMNQRMSACWHLRGYD